MRPMPNMPSLVPEYPKVETDPPVGQFLGETLDLFVESDGIGKDLLHQLLRTLTGALLQRRDDGVETVNTLGVGA